MNRTCLAWLIFFLLMISQTAVAEVIRQMSWDDLIPPHLKQEDVFSDLTPDQRDMVIWVIRMLETLPDRGPDTEEFYKEIDKAMPTLERAGVDIVSVMEKRKAIRTGLGNRGGIRKVDEEKAVSGRRFCRYRHRLFDEGKTVKV